MSSQSQDRKQSQEETSELKRRLQEEYATLLQKEHQLDKEIAILNREKSNTESLNDHMKHLHEYNEIKDATQVVLGNLAVLEEVTVGDLHKRYGLQNDNDN